MADINWLDIDYSGLNPDWSPKKFKWRSTWEKLKSFGSNLWKWTKEAVLPMDIVRAVKWEDFDNTWLALDLMTVIPWAKWVKAVKAALGKKLTASAKKKLTKAIKANEKVNTNLQSWIEWIAKSEKKSMTPRKKDAIIKRNVEEIQWRQDDIKALKSKKRAVKKDIDRKVTWGMVWAWAAWAAATIAWADTYPDENWMDIDYGDIDKTMERNNEEMSKRLIDYNNNKEEDIDESTKEEPKRKTFIDWLDEQWLDSSKEHRKSMAEKLWIENYDFSAEKNMELWKRLKDADPLEFKNTEVSDEDREKQIREAQAKQWLF